MFANLNEMQLEKVFKILSEYANKGVMKVCDDEKQGKYYCPNVLVWKDKSTSACRLCLDASCRTCTGESANSIMIKGSKLQNVYFMFGLEVSSACSMFH